MATLPSQTITTDGTYLLFPIVRKGDYLYELFIGLSGTFASASIGISISMDGGTTKIPLPNISGTTFAATAATVFRASLPNGSTNSDMPLIYAVVTGSTGSTSVLIQAQNNQ